MLPSFGFSFDICVHPQQLPACRRMAESCPEVRFVLDHVGKPPIRSGALDAWRADVRALAKLPNVWCKLSGLCTEADPAWRVEHLVPCLVFALECFGPDRCLFGSDWPVAAIAVEYVAWVGIVTSALSGLRSDQRQAVLGENGSAFYRLGR
jgi:L-fuconolactonase